jgi:two-component system, sensor histidine kinase and response regulator
MSATSINSQVAAAVQERAHEHFQRHRQSNFCRTDRLFAGLLVFQWIASIGVAAWISPRTWAGSQSEVHIHLWGRWCLAGSSSVCRLRLP